MIDYKSLVTILVILFVVSCGGGGSGKAATSNDDSIQVDISNPLSTYDDTYDQKKLIPESGNGIHGYVYNQILISPRVESVDLMIKSNLISWLSDKTNEEFFVKNETDIFKNPMDIWLVEFPESSKENVRTLKNEISQYAEINSVLYAKKILPSKDNAEERRIFGRRIQHDFKEGSEFDSPYDLYGSGSWYFEHQGLTDLLSSKESINNSITVGVIDSSLHVNHDDICEYSDLDPRCSDVTLIYELHDGEYEVGENSHGTAVSGIINTGGINNGVGVRGITSSSLYFYSYYDSLLDNYSPEGYSNVIFKFIGKTKLINISLSLSKNTQDVTNLNREDYLEGDYINSLKEELSELRKIFDSNKEILFVISAGNESLNSDDVSNGYVHYINGVVNKGTRLNNVIIVSASDQLNTLHGYSNYGYGSDLSAPSGIAALNCVKDKKSYYYAYNDENKNAYGVAKGQYAPTEDEDDECVGLQAFYGTSASAPIVTGVAALIWNIEPLLSSVEIKDLLVNNGSGFFSRTRWGKDGVERLPDNASIPILNAKYSYEKTLEYVENNAEILDAYITPNKKYAVGDAIDVEVKTKFKSSDVTLELNNGQQYISMQRVKSYPTDTARYYLYQASITVSKEGDNEYVIRSRTSSGELVSSFSGNFSVASLEEDDAPPVFINADILSQITASQTAYFTGSVSDDRGLSSISMNVTNPNGITSEVFSENLSGESRDLNNYFFGNRGYIIGVGQYTIELIATDNTGQESSVFFNVDVTGILGRINGISPTTATKDQRQTFVISGSNFPTTATFSIQGCENGSLTRVNSSRVNYSCIPRTSGSKLLYGAMSSNGTSMENSGEYTIQVQAVVSDLPVFSSGVNIVQTARGFDLNWLAASGGDSPYRYELYRSTSSGSNGSRIYSGYSLSYTDTSVLGGVRYYYTARACNDSDCVWVWGKQDSSRFNSPVLSGGVNIISQSWGFKLNWREATGAPVSRYELYRSTSSGTLGERVYSGTEISTNDILLGRIDKGTTLYYTARACNNAGCDDSDQSFSTYE